MEEESKSIGLMKQFQNCFSNLMINRNQNNFLTVALKMKGEKCNASAHELNRLVEFFFLYLSHATLEGDFFCNWESTTFMWHFLQSMTCSAVMYAVLN